MRDDKRTLGSLDCLRLLTPISCPVPGSPHWECSPPTAVRCAGPPRSSFFQTGCCVIFPLRQLVLCQRGSHVRASASSDQNPSAKKGTSLPVKCQLQPLRKTNSVPFPIALFMVDASSTLSFSRLITHHKCSSLCFVISRVSWEAM